ncbi:TetR family transcriptional regulator [Opitutaceae bacterium EW11]|nr:TetR family transcriptional regulator [Opitutaceae bacterium EW11]
MTDAAATKPSSPKRDQLLDTAWRLFYRDGYHAVGIDTILAEAGVAKMTLYNHFASKDELIAAVLEKRHQEFVGALNAALEKSGKTGAKRLLAVFDWLEEWMTSPGFNGCTFIRAVAEYPRAEERPHVVAAEHKQWVIDYLAELARAASLKDPASLGRQLALVMEGAIVTAHTFGAKRVGRLARESAQRLIGAS